MISKISMFSCLFQWNHIFGELLESLIDFDVSNPKKLRINDVLSSTGCIGPISEVSKVALQRWSFPHFSEAFWVRVIGFIVVFG